ncbi:zinc dependent phospholipase C family protein [Pseudalkalibacillus sp. Hm43]|uniref:zinc dependent phospholipase C family protein n=1 Tax=Pseudalkalibacillus sp. Hm43 TaxID=3450742 RepID=UPI003F4403BE
MATWMAHFRIAENLLKRGLRVPEKEFVVGNIGPDCGLPDEDTGEFYPSPEVTHFKVDKKITPNLFLEQYLNKDQLEFTTAQLSFYLGYYVHLVTDVEWSALHQEKKKEPVYRDILGTPEYTRKIKSDWYGGDFVYLNENRDNIFTNAFQHIESFPDYLDLFPEHQITKQIKRITEFYLSDVGNFALDPTYEFKYLTPEEVSRFVEETSEKLVHNLNATFDKELLWEKQAHSK